MEKVYPLRSMEFFDADLPAARKRENIPGGPGLLAFLGMHDTKTSEIDDQSVTLKSPFRSGVKLRFQAIKEHLFSLLGDEAVILSLKNGKYYSLNSVGSSIWKVIQEPAELSDIEAAILMEYDVDPKICRNETVLFLEKMIAEDLILTIDEQGN